MKKITFLLTILVLFLGSCRSTYQTIGSVRPQIVMIDTIQSEMVINKNSKIQGSAVMRKFLTFKTKFPTNFAENEATGTAKGDIERLKSAALRDALNTNNVDYLIAPKYDIVVSKTLLTKEVIVKVEGFGANLKIK